MAVDGKRLVTVFANVSLVANTAFVAGTVISNSATTGAVLTFANVVEEKGGTGFIIGAGAYANANMSGARLTTYLYNTNAVTSNVNSNTGSNAPLHADLGFYQKSIDYPAMSLRGGDSYSEVSSSTLGNAPIPFQCAPGDTNLYAIQMTQDAIANIAALTGFQIKLTVEPY